MDIGTRSWLNQMEDSGQRLEVLHRAIDSTANGIIVTDPHLPDNPIIYANPAFSALTGYEQQEIVGRNCRFLQKDDHDQPALDHLRAAIKEERAITCLLRNYRKDGTLFWNELTVSPVHSEGRLVNFVGVQNDVTARVEAEKQVAAFYALVSHELKAPIACIAGALGAIEEGSSDQLPKQTSRLIELANNNCAKLTALIEEILDWKRLQSAEFRINKRWVRPGELFEQIVSEFRAVTSTRELIVSDQTEQSLNCDPDRIAQVLTNLVSNAIKFSPQSSPMTISAAPQGEKFVRFEVIDHGKGVPDSQKAKIFSEYYQLEQDAARGTGLGLSIAKSIVQLHGGTIGVKDTPGGGCTFWFDLPV